MKIEAITFFMVAIIFSSCSNEEKQEKTTNDSKEKIELEENLAKKIDEVNYSKLLKGKYVLDESDCAGFEFVNSRTVLWTNEIQCDYPDTLKIKWIDNKTFLTIQTTRSSEECPPKVDLYKLVSLEQNTLTLKSIWTGWNEFKDEELILTKK